MTVAVYGGAFDPFHYGHLDIVLALSSMSRIDRIVLVPANVSVGKESAYFSVSVRKACVDAIATSIPKVVVCDYELTLAPPAYTIHTLHHIRQWLGRSDIALVVGFDQMMNIHRWHMAEQVLAMHEIIAVPRVGITQTIPPHLITKKYPITVLDCLPANVSSTQIKANHRKGISIDNLVPKKILKKLT